MFITFIRLNYQFTALMEVGWIDLVGFMTLFTTGINCTPMVTLQYWRIGLSFANMDMLKECQKQVDFFQ